MASRFSVDLADYQGILEASASCSMWKQLMRHTKTGDTFFVTRYYRDFTNADDKRAFMEGLKRIFELDHPVIDGIVGFNISNDKTLSLLWPHHHNGSLSDVMLRMRFRRANFLFNSTQMSIIVIGIVSGLNYLHSKGIIHGCLNPECIHLDIDNHPFITEMNINSLLRTKSHPSHLSKTFLAPEVLRKNSPSFESDVYSFGLILFRLVASKVLFQDASNVSFIDKILNGLRPEIPDYVSSTIKDIIRRCWDEDPSQRPTISEILQIVKDNYSTLFPNPNLNTIERYYDTIFKMSLMESSLPEDSSSDSDAETSIPTTPHEGSESKSNSLKIAKKSNKFSQGSSLFPKLAGNNSNKIQHDFIKKEKFQLVRKYFSIYCCISNLTENNFTKNLKRLFFVLNRKASVSSYEIAEMIIYVVKARYTDNLVYVNLVQNLFKFDNIEALKYIKVHILGIIKNKFCNSDPFKNELQLVSFLYNLMRFSKVLPVQEIVHWIKEYSEETNYRNKSGIFVLFAWFAPELEKFDLDLYNKLLTFLQNTKNDIDTHFAQKFFLDNLEKYRENNWNFTKLKRSKKDMLDFPSLIVRDDVNALRKKLQNIRPPIRLRISENIYIPCNICQNNPTLLMFAAAYGAVKCFQILCMKGAIRENRDDKYMHLSQFAAAGGDYRIMRYLLADESNIDSALQSSISFHNFDFFYNLSLNENVDINMPDRFGKLPITVAVASSNVKVFLYLIHHGVSINSQESFGRSPLHVAAEAGNITMLNMILNIKNLNHNITDTWGNTPLHLAVEKLNIKVCEILLKLKQVDVNIQNEEGLTPFHLAVRTGSIKLTQLFLDDNRVNMNTQDNKGNTPLISAVKDGNKEIVKELIKIPEVEKNITNKAGMTAFDVSNKLHHVEISKLFVQQDSSLKSCNVY